MQIRSQTRKRTRCRKQGGKRHPNRTGRSSAEINLIIVHLYSGAFTLSRRLSSACGAERRQLGRNQDWQPGFSW